MVTNLTTEQIESIQTDEGLLFVDYGEDTERFLAPTRGGGEFNATAKIRDIEFDGRHGKTAGTQVIEEQDANLKVTTLDLSQKNLVLAIPNCVIIDNKGKTIKNPRTGIIKLSSYLKNITMFTKLVSGKFKKITIYNPMHENGLAVKAVPKSEGELALDFSAHYSHSDLDGDLWSIEEITEAPSTKKDTEQTPAEDAGATEQNPAEKTDNEES